MGRGAGLLLALPLWLWWAVWQGGYPATVFLGGLIYFAAVCLLLQLTTPATRPRGAQAVALVALGALAAFAVLSIVWADDQGSAEVAAARWLLAFAALAIPLLWPPSAWALRLAVAAFVTVALIGIATGLAEAMDDPLALGDGRLLSPTGYANATGALAAMAALPALVFASDSALAPTLRVYALAAAGPLVGAVVLTQSRGAVAALLLGLLLALALVPARLRLLVPIALVALVLLPAFEVLLDVREVSLDADPRGAVASATVALVLMAAALALLGAGWLVLESRVRPGTDLLGAVPRVARIAIAGLLVAGAIAFVATQGNPVTWASDRFDDFQTADYEQLEAADTRFTGDLGSNRYDYWRASLEIFADRPLGGAGAGNFLAPYLEIREGEKATAFAHSVWLGTLAELGLPGFLALLTAVGALIFGLLRARIGARVDDRTLVSAAALPLFYVLVHGSADWITAFPVVIAPALALAGSGACLGSDGRMGRAGGPWSLTVTVMLVLAGLAAVPLLISARLSDRGVAQTGGEAATKDLERAADLDPLSAAPLVREGMVALELGNTEQAFRAFERALERDPSAWYPRMQLGLLLAGSEREAALEWLREAEALNPVGRELRRVLRAVERGESPDPLEVQHQIQDPSRN